jgi:hypothetical protein
MTTMPARPFGLRGRLPTLGSSLPVLAHHVDPALPAPKAPWDWAPEVTGGFPMALNDTYGDCVIAGVVHLLQLSYAVVGDQFPYPGDDAVKATYFGLTGGADTGLNEQDVLRTWMTDGLFGTKIVAAAQVHLTDFATQKVACYNFGGLMYGWDLPAIAEQEFAQGVPWSLRPGSNPPVGGHCTCGSGYNPGGGADITWGAENAFTYNFARYYLEECYVVLTERMVAAGHGALASVDVAALTAACQAWAARPQAA